jgi:hypothetical protein
VFLLPADSGDKVSLGVTVFLAISVFMLVISEKVPVTSQSVPLIGMYMVFYVLKYLKIYFQSTVEVTVSIF